MEDTKTLEVFNTLTYFFEFKNENSILNCTHAYGKHNKSSFDIGCKIDNTDFKTVKKAIAKIKKAISEAKKDKSYPALHGCTTYLDTINLLN